MRLSRIAQAEDFSVFDTSSMKIGSSSSLRILNKGFRCATGLGPPSATPCCDEAGASTSSEDEATMAYVCIWSSTAFWQDCHLCGEDLPGSKNSFLWSVGDVVRSLRKALLTRPATKRSSMQRCERTDSSNSGTWNTATADLFTPRSSKPATVRGAGCCFRRSITNSLNRWRRGERS